MTDKISVFHKIYFTLKWILLIPFLHWICFQTTTELYIFYVSILHGLFILLFILFYLSFCRCDDVQMWCVIVVPFQVLYPPDIIRYFLFLHSIFV